MSKVTLYLDCDTLGNDLLDSVGNPISAGWYVYKWPITDDPEAGPFEYKADAIHSVESV